MAFIPSSQHPSLEIGRLRIPGPAIPIAIANIPLFVRPQNLGRILLHPASKTCLRGSLGIIHRLLYLCTVCELASEKEPGKKVPMLEYLALVLGEVALEESNFWLYTPLAFGWVLSTSSVLSSQQIPGLSQTYAVACFRICLIASIFSALDMNEEVSQRVAFSTWALVPRTMCLGFTKPIATGRLPRRHTAAVHFPRHYVFAMRYCLGESAASHGPSVRPKSSRIGFRLCNVVFSDTAHNLMRLR